MAAPAPGRTGSNRTARCGSTSLRLRSLEQVEDGAAPDLLITTTSGLVGLARRGLVHGESITPVASTGIGLAVRAGADHPDISTVAALSATLQAAKSVALSRTGASGQYFTALLDRLGLTEAVLARATVIDQGFTATAVAAGHADLAVQQLSELLLIDGIDVLGPLPDDVQHSGQRQG